jgi:hypothetical protein
MAMNKQEAKELLSQEMQRWRARSYADLAALVNEVTTKDVTGASGVAYQIEIQVFWDSKPYGNLRVLGGIDDGGWSAFKPLNDDFIIAPDGSFIGE